MELLKILADGAWHAGPQLAQELGISRAAVNKQVKKAATLGLEIDAVRGRGYRMRSAFEPLLEKVIWRGLSSAATQALDNIQVLSTVGSTNNYLLDNDYANGAQACLAEYQSAGRGRRGRQWVSPYGANLYFSVAWPFAQTPPGLGALSLAVGVELATVLRSHGAEVRLKWPNDLYIGPRKLGGILIEHRGEIAGRSRVVVGAGLNLRMAGAQAADIDQPWTALAEHIDLPARNVLAAQALDSVVRALSGFETGGFAAYRNRWQALDMACNQPVWVDTGSEKISGRATGVASDGALLVDCGTGLRRFYSGEVSLRLSR